SLPACTKRSVPEETLNVPSPAGRLASAAAGTRPCPPDAGKTQLIFCVAELAGTWRVRVRVTFSPGTPGFHARGRSLVGSMDSAVPGAGSAGATSTTTWGAASVPVNPGTVSPTALTVRSSPPEYSRVVPAKPCAV